MDVNDLRNLTTVLSFVIFLGILVWAMSAGNRARFDEAQRLPFIEDDISPDAPRGSKEIWHE